MHRPTLNFAIIVGLALLCTALLLLGQRGAALALGLCIPPLSMLLSGRIQWKVGA